jgi:hypothetical protein
MHVYVLSALRHVLCFIWNQQQNFENPLIMTMKQKSLDLGTKLEIIQECEVGSLWRSEIGTQYGINSPISFVIWNARIFGIY